MTELKPRNLDTHQKCTFAERSEVWLHLWEDIIRILWVGSALSHVFLDCKSITSCWKQQSWCFLRYFPSGKGLSDRLWNNAFIPASCYQTLSSLHTIYETERHVFLCLTTFVFPFPIICAFNRKKQQQQLCSGIHWFKRHLPYYKIKITNVQIIPNILRRQR